MSVIAKVRTQGNSLVVTIPDDEVGRLGLTAGDMVELSLIPMELRAKLDPELQATADRVFARHEGVFRRLAEYDRTGHDPALVKDQPRRETISPAIFEVIERASSGQRDALDSLDQESLLELRRFLDASRSRGEHERVAS